jgi:hypothetical protein
MCWRRQIFKSTTLLYWFIRPRTYDRCIAVLNFEWVLPVGDSWWLVFIPPEAMVCRQLDRAANDVFPGIFLFPRHVIAIPISQLSS